VRSVELHETGKDETRMEPTLAERFRFFHEHAGYVVGRRAVCAIALARAELQAEARGWRVTWEDEIEPWDGEPADDPPVYIFCAVLRDEFERPRASLGMVGVNSRRDPYLRVVAAELADEALIEECERERLDYERSG